MDVYFSQRDASSGERPKVDALCTGSLLLCRLEWRLASQSNAKRNASRTEAFFCVCSFCPPHFYADDVDGVDGVDLDLDLDC